MTWEKLVEREGDFLKNYLLYENFAENFPKIFNKNHSGFLTIRKDDTFTHCVHKETAKEISLFIKQQLEKNFNFMKDVVNKGKEHFFNLIRFSEALGNIKKLDNEKLAELAEEYFSLYKAPYPYFNLTIFTDELEKSGDKEIINLMAAWRLFARTTFNKTHELIEPLFKEIGKRLDLSIKEVKFLTPNEIKEVLLKGNINIDEKIKNRKHCYFIYENGKFELHENKIFELDEDFLKELKGMGTFPAFYKGKVKLIKNKKDMENIEKGDIIVLRMTTPDLVTEGIKKAGAIITDEGGITCHAAVLSREFNIPALMGTKIATKLLKDGDIVEVDTEKGVANKVN